MENPLQSIPVEELSIAYVLASGPGGQNVNKVASAAQLRFDVRNSACFSEAVKQRLVRLAGKRMTADGVLVIVARRYRERERNRLDALARLYRLVEHAQQPPVKRIPTRPHPGAVKERLADKKKRSAAKRSRQFKAGTDD